MVRCGRRKTACATKRCGDEEWEPIKRKRPVTEVLEF
jgi:hypothetical protein